jgi:hypothetical protein
LDAKVFPDWSALIVATYRAQVNDSEAVDALGKVEITQSKTPVTFRRGKVGEKKQKSRRELSPCEQAKEKPSRPLTLLSLP